MFEKIKIGGTKALTYLEKLAAGYRRSNLLKTCEAYERLRSATPSPVAPLYPSLPANFRELPDDRLEELKQSLPLGIAKNGQLANEIALKKNGQNYAGNYEFKYQHGGFPTFHYYSSKSVMLEPERMLAAYAGIALMYGFIKPLTEKQLVWVAIHRTLTEVISDFSLRRLRTGIGPDYEDTREMSAIYEFGRAVKHDVPHAWRVLLLLIEKNDAKGPSAVGKRLVAEVNAAGWANG